MRSVLGASRALEELVRLLPDTAILIDASGATREVPVSDLKPGDRTLIRPGAPPSCGSWWSDVHVHPSCHGH